MKQQDFEDETKARTKKSNNLLSKSGLCGLVTMLSMALGGCSNNKVQITGKVKRIESSFVSTKLHKDEKTGQFTNDSYSKCVINIKSMGIIYDLNIYDSEDTQLCGKVLEESAGIHCCEKLKTEYNKYHQRSNLCDNNESDKKKQPDIAAKCEQCKGIKCDYPLFQYNFDSGYAYVADINDGSKSPTIILITDPKHIKDEKDSNGNTMKEVHVDRKDRENPSQVSVQPSSYVAAERVKSSILQSFKQWLY